MGGFRRTLGLAIDFFPRADPAKIDIGKVFARFFEHDRGVFGQLDRGAQEKPMRPMRSVESGNEHVGKFSRAACHLLQSPSIGFARQSEIAFFSSSLKR